MIAPTTATHNRTTVTTVILRKGGAGRERKRLWEIYMYIHITFLFEKLKAEPHPHWDTPLIGVHGRLISGTCNNNERRLRDRRRNFWAESSGGLTLSLSGGETSLEEPSFDSSMNISSGAESWVEPASELKASQS